MFEQADIDGSLVRLNRPGDGEVGFGMNPAEDVALEGKISSDQIRY